MRGSPREAPEAPGVIPDVKDHAGKKGGELTRCCTEEEGGREGFLFGVHKAGPLLTLHRLDE
jgi:hypothetical protein